MKLDNSPNAAYADSCGNTFILIDERRSDLELSHQLIVRLCENRGVDGLIAFNMHPKLRSTYIMRYYNRDGFEAELCGNGLASLGAWIHQLDGKDVFKVISRAGKHTLSIQIGEKGQVSVKCAMPKIEDIEEVTLDGETLFIAKCGVPHALLVTSEENIQALIESRAKHFRSHPYFSRRGGVNVSAVCIDNKRVVAQTFERGVEAVTLSCGTGASVIAYFAHLKQGLKYPIEVQMPGGSLFVDSSKEGAESAILICKPSLEPLEVKALC
jgi:diaminopimelate epimerase